MLLSARCITSTSSLPRTVNAKTTNKTILDRLPHFFDGKTLMDHDNHHLKTKPSCVGRNVFDCLIMLDRRTENHNA